MTNEAASGQFPEAYIRTLRLALAFVFGIFTRNLLLIVAVVVLAAGAGAAFLYSTTPLTSRSF